MLLRRRRQNNERGAALVEMAMVTPLLVLLVFGILEFGLAFRDRLTVSNATQSAGRVAAALGNSDEADYAVLQAVEQSLGILPGAGGGIIKHVPVCAAESEIAVLDVLDTGFGRHQLQLVPVRHVAVVRLDSVSGPRSVRRSELRRRVHTGGS